MTSFDHKTNKNDPNWNQSKEKGSPWALAFIVWFFKLLGPGLTYGLTYFIIWFYYLTDGPKRRHTADYLGRLHDYAGEKSPFAKQPGFWQGLKLYQNFGEIIVDRFVNWTQPEKEFFDIEWKGQELLRAQIQTKRGALILSGHFGNVEVLRADAQGEELPVKMLMFVENAQKYVKMLGQINPQVMDHLICLESLNIGNLSLLQEEIEQGHLIGILADRITEGAPGKTSSLPWLGKDASFPQGPFALATILEVPVYTFFVFKSGPRKYEVEVRPIFDGQPIKRKERQAAIEKMQLDFLGHWEKLCVRYPYQWFNFYDFWKS